MKKGGANGEINDSWPW